MSANIRLSDMINSVLVPVNWAIPDKNRTPPRKAIRLSAVVSFDTDNIQGNLFGCLPWVCTRFLSGIAHYIRSRSYISTCVYMIAEYINCLPL